jgi:hypothetical protein
MSQMILTKPRRAALAKALCQIVAERAGQAVEHVKESIGRADCLTFCIAAGGAAERVNTVLGPLRWASFAVTPKGVQVHIAFEDVERAKPLCTGINPYTGKWNHYLFPATREGAEESILAEFAEIIARITKPKN